MTKEESLKKDIEKAIENLEKMANLKTITIWGEGYKSGLYAAITHLQFTLKLHELSRDFYDGN